MKKSSSYSSFTSRSSSRGTDKNFIETVDINKLDDLLDRYAKQSMKGTGLSYNLRRYTDLEEYQ